jgi:GT2 family glycosyltransferase
MTVFNRREKTLQCLRNLQAQTAVNRRLQYDVYLMDDGSKDGTSEAVKEAFPEVHLRRGDGNLFWNGGMNAIFGEALKGDYDFYLWLNDDTFLYPDAMDKLLDAWETRNEAGHPDSIIIGGTIDPDTRLFSYGGFERYSNWTLKLRHIAPYEDKMRQCDTMCGNCVLIPKAVSDKIGNIEPFYKHRWGDPDYGLRTTKAGGSIWMTPGYIGTCEANPLAEAWTDNTLSIKERIKDFHSVKGYRKEDWFFYVRRHGGPLWILLWLKPYYDIITSSMLYKLNGKAKRKI